MVYPYQTGAVMRRIFDALGYLDNWEEILLSNGSYVCIGAAGNEIDADAIGIL
jgi:hypothetical protein